MINKAIQNASKQMMILVVVLVAILVARFEMANQI